MRYYLLNVSKLRIFDVDLMTLFYIKFKDYRVSHHFLNIDNYSIRIRDSFDLCKMSKKQSSFVVRKSDVFKVQYIINRRYDKNVSLDNTIHQLLSYVCVCKYNHERFWNYPCKFMLITC